VLDRPRHHHEVFELMDDFPVVGLLGPRQSGKTTLARQIAGAAATNGQTHWFDLEDPESARQLDAPMLALRDLTGLIVIDEIQRRPTLFPALRVLRRRRRGRTRGSSETAMVPRVATAPSRR
jgi:predicted AAA+ superfamily ATPase